MSVRNWKTRAASEYQFVMEDFFSFQGGLLQDWIYAYGNDGK